MGALHGRAPVPALPHAPERVLNDVLGLLETAGHHPQQAEQALLLELEEVLEGVLDGHDVAAPFNVASACSIRPFARMNTRQGQSV